MDLKTVLAAVRGYQSTREASHVAYLDLKKVLTPVREH